MHTIRTLTHVIIILTKKRNTNTYILFNSILTENMSSIYVTHIQYIHKYRH